MASYRLPTRVAAALALVSLLATSTTSAVSHAGDGHAGGCEWIGPHDPDAHRIETASAQADPHQPCAICHSARELRHVPAVAGTLRPQDGSDHRLRHAHVPLPRAACVSQPLLRSPPEPALLAVL